MKNKIGAACLAIGILLLAISGKMYLDMMSEENAAAVSSAVAVEEIKTAIGGNPSSPDEGSKLESIIAENRQSDENEAADEAVFQELTAASAVNEAEEIPEKPQETEQPQMKTISVDGSRYIGYLELPSLGLSLPVMESWDYKNLKISPCRYWGSAQDNSLIILAHNYDRHFGRIKDMHPGDKAQFVDVDGISTPYAVEEVLVMEPDETKQMIENRGDLTLFTCTKGGKHRVVVRLRREN